MLYIFGFTYDFDLGNDFVFNFNDLDFVFDFNDFESNPLLTNVGRSQILSLENETGVKVLSVCADYFMEAPLHKGPEQSIEKHHSAACGISKPVG